MTDDIKTPDEEQKSDEEQKEEQQEQQNDAPAGSEQNNTTPPSETEETSDSPSEGELGAIYDVPVQVSAVLGKANLHVNQLLKLGRGAVVELDRKVGEAIDIFVNNRLVARGEIVVMDDEHIGVTMTEIIKTESKKL